MRTPLRTAAAMAAGVLVAAVLAYLGLAVFVLATIGLPLGASPAPLRAPQYAMLLALAASAAAVGGRTARRVAREHGNLPVWGVAAILATAMLWGFSGPSSWPAWSGAAAAAAMALGASCGASRRLRRPRP